MLRDQWSGRRVRNGQLCLATEVAETHEEARTRQAEECARLPPPFLTLANSGGHHAVPKDGVLPVGRPNTRARERWKLRDALRPHQPHRRQRDCGQLPVGPVLIGVGWQRGVSTCGSIWCCPVCSAHERAKRAEEVQHAAQWWRGQGYFVGMLTCTLAHSYHDRLKRNRSGLARAWARTFRGEQGQALRAGYDHLVRGVDCTWGGNGWHPHLHNLVLSKEALSEEWLQAFRKRWADAIEKELGMAARPREDEVGVHYGPAVDERYLLKLGLELNDITAKTGKRDGHFTPWEIGSLAVDEPRYRPIWREWAEAMKGARALTWSRGLRRLAGLPEVEVEEPAEHAPESECDGTAPRWAIVIPSESWRAVCRYPDALDCSDVFAASTKGLEPTLALLGSRGLGLYRSESRNLGSMAVCVFFVRLPTIEELLDRLDVHESAMAGEPEVEAMEWSSQGDPQGRCHDGVLAAACSVERRRGG